MKHLFTHSVLIAVFLLTANITVGQEFQGKAYYFSKSSMELGSWGARLSEAQKKQIQERLKNRLEKTYVLTFNKEESSFKEDQKLDAISGATDSWGKNFSPGEQYKNIKSNEFVQVQEFYGKQFLVKDELQKINWTMSKESKNIGNYMSLKATASIPKSELEWYNFSWSDIRNADSESGDEEMVEVTAWYTPQIPVSMGPSEFWGLPGLILEVNMNNTTMLCSKIVMNPEDKNEIEAPKRGKEVAKMEYKEIITSKMIEMRDNRGRRRN
ncbi:GLPGLI family protein [Flavobacteriaceae sp. LMIT009]